MTRQRVVLFGASGTMGFCAFRELWKRRERYDIVLLLRPSPRNKQRFAAYEQEAGLDRIPGRGVVKDTGLTIVWGDATDGEDVRRAIQGADWVLMAMAVIPPEAGYYPERAWDVNTSAVQAIVRAIEAEPGGADRIKLVHTSTVAETGDRLGCIHRGRVGDPLKPGVFDTYAVSKVTGEWAVLESRIRHWVSLRLSYILPTSYREYVGLLDPILFHLPLETHMEVITDRDAGHGLVNCLEIQDGSDFWRRVYNMAGGPAMRCIAHEYLDRNFQLLGLSGVRACTRRRWFALRNFYLYYYDDSDVLERYLHFQRDTLEGFYAALGADMPVSLKALARLNRSLPLLRRAVERSVYLLAKRMVERHPNGTAYWARRRCDLRISAFYKDHATYQAIPDWKDGAGETAKEPECIRLDHGYDESKTNLELADLQAAAQFRGGACLAPEWDGDLYGPLPWRCAREHCFDARPYTVLKAGHWCPACAAPPWNYDREARYNRFLAQAWYPNHSPAENNYYPADCIRDVSRRGRR